jgi:hypothetical protein
MVNVPDEANKMLDRIYRVCNSLARQGATFAEQASYNAMIITSMLEIYHGVAGDFSMIEHGMELKYNKKLIIKIEPLEKDDE